MFLPIAWREPVIGRVSEQLKKSNLVGAVAPARLLQFLSVKGRDRIQSLPAEKQTTKL